MSKTKERSPEEQARFETFKRRYMEHFYIPEVITPAARRYLVEQAERYDIGGCE